jgi:hypothetical protein
MGFAVGDRVLVEGFECQGTVRFVGDHHEKQKPRVGVELDEPVAKSAGKFMGHKYFTCPKACGVLVLPKVVSAAPAEVVMFDAETPKEAPTAPAVPVRAHARMVVVLLSFWCCCCCFCSCVVSDMMNEVTS